MKHLLFRHRWLFAVLMSLYPPFLGAGIWVRRVSKDFREIEVRLSPRLFNRNAMGTAFGGSLYAMTDPFLVLMFAANLGKGYDYWDRSAQIQFQRPGRGPVHARFKLEEGDFERARAATAGGLPYTPVFTVYVRDPKNRTIATVRKELYIRRRAATT